MPTANLVTRGFGTSPKLVTRGYSAGAAVVVFSSYASATDMIRRYDVRRLGELVRDNGTRATSGQLLSDTIMQEMLDDGTGMIEAACRVGKKYTRDDLDGMTGADEHLLIRLNCDLAYGSLLKRRGTSAQAMQEMAPRYFMALDILKKIWCGEWVFDLDAVKEAGLPEGDIRLSKDVDLLAGNTPRYFGKLFEFE